MSAPNTTFQTAKWMRVGIQTPVIIRPPKIEDMDGMKVVINGHTTDFTGAEFVTAVSLPATWKLKNQHWQEALDAFVVQRVDFVLTVKKECDAGSVDTATLNSEVIGKTELEYFYGATSSHKITYTYLDLNPSSSNVWILDSLDCDDRRNGLCDVVAKFRNIGYWNTIRRNPNALVTA